MKLDLVSGELSENIFSINSFLLFGYAFALGYIPLGSSVVLAFLGYLFTKENEEKYIFLIGYFFACISEGVLFSYEEMLLVGLWFVVVLLFFMIIRNPLGYIPFISVGLLIGYGIYLEIYFVEILKNILVYLLLFIALRSLFFKSKEIMLFMGISVLMLLYLIYMPLIMNIDAILFLLSLTLISVSWWMSLPYLLILLALGIIVLGNSPYYLPTILFWVVYKECNPSSLLLYISYVISLCIVSQNPFFIISGSVFAGVVICLNRDIEQDVIPEESENFNRSTKLLKQFARICRSMVGVGIESSLIQVMSDVFEKSATELENLTVYEHYPSLIKDALTTYHYDYREVEIHYESALFIRLQLYNTNKLDIKNTVIPILETVLHTTLYLQDYQRSNFLHSYHECVLVAHPCVNLKYDYLQRAKKDVCGDEVNVISRFEKKVFFLSDGMGEGYKAKEQSKFAIQFLSELFLIGIPFTQMIRVINQFLLLKQSESFATLDILCIDTLSKQCYLYKAGSAQTYLIRDGTTHLFEAQSLPLGIVSRITPDVYSFSVKEGDLIVMMSDGAESELMEQWLTELKDSQPSALLGELYSYKEKEKIMDDLSILAIRIQNNFHFY